MESKRALVIGGTGGVGLACTRTLHRLGCKVTAQGRGGSKSSPDLPAGIQKIWMTLESPSKAVISLEQASGPLRDWDILICSFGPFIQGRLEDADPQDWEQMALLNLALPGALVSRVLPGMMERGFGRIILFGGTASDQYSGYHQTAVYQSAKAGLGVLAKSVSRQAAARGVTCNVVCPGYIETEYYSEDMKQQARRHLPQGVPAKPEDLDELVALLVKNSANLINGAIISSGQGL